MQRLRHVYRGEFAGVNPAKNLFVVSAKNLGRLLSRVVFAVDHLDSSARKDFSFEPLKPMLWRVTCFLMTNCLGVRRLLEKRKNPSDC